MKKEKKRNNAIRSQVVLSTLEVNPGGQVVHENLVWSHITPLPTQIEAFGLHLWQLNVVWLQKLLLFPWQANGFPEQIPIATEN